MDEDISRRPAAAGEPQVASGREYSPFQPPDDIAVATTSQAPDTDVEQGQSPGEAGQGADPLGELQPPTPGGERNRVLGGIRELVETIILALIFFFALRAVVQNFRVEGSSMFPSFADGQYVLVNKAVYTHINPRALPNWVPLGGSAGPVRYLFHPPERGDVIVFHPPPPNDPHRDFIKRVMGVPGDTIDIRQGHVYVNSAELSESYIRQPTLPINVRFAHAVLGPGEYFVLGDNRGNSSDSRAWGPVTADEIVGRTWLVYWPFSALKVAPNHFEAAPAPAPTTP